MEPLKKLLSPFTIENEANIALLTDKIKKQKMDVLNKKIPPSEVDSVRPEIVTSWIRSFNHGLDPSRYHYPPVLDKESLEKRLIEKAPFIQAAKPYVQQLEYLLSSEETYIILSDEQGVILCMVDELGNNKYNLVPGSVWNEETTGTCAHGMCIILKSPIQLCGAEHFSRIFSSISCSSAPVYGVNGNLEGTLSIVSPCIQSQNALSLAFVITMSMAIQKDFQLNDENDMFNATFMGTTDAMIVLDDKGTIVAVNEVANAMLETPDQVLVGSNIEEIIGPQPFFETVIEMRKPILNIDIQVKKKKQTLHLFSALPVNNKSNGCILTFKKVEQAIKNGKPSNGSITRFTFDRIVGSSQQTLKSISYAKKFALSDYNIMIQGESGTGKEVYAQAIHNASRPDGPFIALNCAAIPKDLIESELFGYEGGAFTGAERQGRSGKIEQANGGTLFLDEIGDMPIELQAVLLRALEDKIVTHVGGSRYISVNFRLITATNRNLQELVKKKQFREDLYYRISVFSIVIPPLRERGSEIIQLAEHFVNIFSQENGLQKLTLSSATKYVLLDYNWPGNVRQLQNAMLYAVCMCSDGTIRPDCLPEEICKSTRSYEEQMQTELIANNTSENNSPSMKDIEKMVIKKALDENSNIRSAAKMLGLSKSTLYRKIKEYNLIHEI
ncbi:sigma-54-dependent Fis family transcriptional regulator [Desulfitobacterium sp. Sab5]|uniref:sigma-54-dependent Fis family transcriptional regulator n=1 Tax=Desulfitobacterium nosdiversum TaxID=3375356 RepID=UPI003CF1316B